LLKGAINVLYELLLFHLAEARVINHIFYDHSVVGSTIDF